MPLVLACPHDGTCKPFWVKRRDTTCRKGQKKAVTVRDTGTIGVTCLVAQVIKRVTVDVVVADAIVMLVLC